MEAKKHIIYDIETYPNIFTLCAVFADGKGLRVFEISDRKNELDKMLEYLRNVVINKYHMVGFNNIGFDYPVIHRILLLAQESKRSGEPLNITSKQIYKWAQEIIDSNRGEGFSSNVKADEVIIPQIDLYKINHYDNKAKRTGLKLLEFNMRSENIEDLPFPVGMTLTDEQKDVLVTYNKHDVLQTLKFYNLCLGMIQLREDLTKRFGFDCTNMNDSKIGSEYFISRLEKAMPQSCYKVGRFGRKINQTKRSKIVVKDILFPYLQFTRPEFKAVYEWFKQQVITETKGVFSDLLEKDVGDVAKYARMTTKRKKLNDPVNKNNKRYVPSFTEIQLLKRGNAFGWVEEKELKSPKGAKSYYWCWNEIEAMNVVVNGLEYVFGTGGIHASVENAIFRSDEEYVIIDADVSSMYPNIAIANRVYPEHLSEKFCDIYEAVYEERKRFPKKSAENAALKLALNGTYGNSNNEYSPFYDPQYTMTITINGQLSLCMLAEKFMTIPNCTIIQCNTDGVTVKIPRSQREVYDKICADWQATVGLQLEFAIYNAMFIANVNNYLAVYEDGTLKNKGAYEYKDLAMHKNHSSLVIPMAAEHQLLGRGTIEDFIRSHKDEYDFMLRTKVDRSSRLVLVMEDGSEVPQQNVCRYYPSTKGGKLVKIMPPLAGKEADGERRLSIDSEWNVQPCNNMKHFHWDIDYNYYFTEAHKLVDCLEEKK